MRRLIPALASALIAAPAFANSTGCGENAFTFAEIVEAKLAKGPVMSVPDSLCADLIEDRKPAIGSLNLQIGDPYATQPTARPRGTSGRTPAR